MNQLRFLGTSTSVGVPVIGCECQTCGSNDPKNKRTRSSIYLEGEFGKILVDSGPDLREQALREKINCVDAVLYTHGHVDHVAGFDELRAFCWRREAPLPLYASQETFAILEAMFPWAFQNGEQSRGYVRPEKRPFNESFTFDGLPITPIEVDHGNVRTHGFRFDLPSSAIAYLPDVKRIPEASLKLLSHLDLLIIDSLREQDHHTHMTIAEALEMIVKLSPKKALLTHISHEVQLDAVTCKLPDHVSFAYDGLVLNI